MGKPRKPKAPRTLEQWAGAVTKATEPPPPPVSLDPAAVLETLEKALAWAAATHQLDVGQLAQARGWLEQQAPKAEPMVRLIVPGPIPRKNARTMTSVILTPKPAGGRKPRACPHCRRPIWAFVHYYPSDDWKDWIDRLQLEVSTMKRITRGAWAIRLRTYAPKVNHLDEQTLHVAFGDVDSATSAVLDGLQQVGMLDDDARFVREGATKHHDKANPRTEIELTPVAGESRKPGKGPRRAPAGTLPLL